MPTYDMVCNACGHEYELFLTRFISDEDKVCPQCASTEVTQRMSNFSMSIGCGASGRGNTGARLSGKPSASQKYMKYRDPKYYRKSR
ncbi:MAG: zinc ribbon domain-containing protein [Thermoleophilia bacterium]